MAIDSAAKRRSSAASRRLPWMRRFGIAPDSTIDQGDRQQAAWVYRGIEADEPAVELPDRILYRPQSTKGVPQYTPSASKPPTGYRPEHSN